MTIYAVVAAADFNRGDFLGRYAAGEFDCVLAVDGGYAHLKEAGVDPDVALGDFDSLGFVPDHAWVVEHPPMKDKSDLELALDFAMERGACALRVYGCLGGRLDHTLAALQALCAAAERGVDVDAVGMPSDQQGYAQGMEVSVLVGPARLELSPASGSTEPFFGVVSVHGACDRCEGVSERGLRYSLEDQVLTNRTSWGLSNELEGRPCSIEVEKGTLLVVHPSSAQARRGILSQ